MPLARGEGGGGEVEARRSKQPGLLFFKGSAEGSSAGGQQAVGGVEAKEVLVGTNPVGPQVAHDDCENAATPGVAADNESNTVARRGRRNRQYLCEKKAEKGRKEESLTAGVALFSQSSCAACGPWGWREQNSWGQLPQEW